MTQHRLDSDNLHKTDIEAGKWMFFPEAMDATGLSERSLRRYMQTKQIKYRKLGKSANARVQLWITDELRHMRLGPEVDSSVLDSTFADEGSFDEIEAEELTDWPKESSSDKDAEIRAALIKEELEQVFKTLTQQFVEKLDEQRELIFELKQELGEKEQQLRLLPDLQKQLETERQNVEFQAAALTKQSEALEQEKQAEFERLQAELEALKQDAQQKDELAKRLAEAESELQSLKQPWWKKWFQSPPAPEQK